MEGNTSDNDLSRKVSANEIKLRVREKSPLIISKLEWRVFITSGYKQSVFVNEVILPFLSVLLCVISHFSEVY